MGDHRFDQQSGSVRLSYAVNLRSAKAPTVDACRGHILTLGLRDLYTIRQVDTLFSNLIESAPVVLNTLNELATALGNDADYAATIQNQLSNKQNKFYTGRNPSEHRPAGRPRGEARRAASELKEAKIANLTLPAPRRLRPPRRACRARGLDSPEGEAQEQMRAPRP